MKLELQRDVPARDVLLHPLALRHLGHKLGPEIESDAVFIKSEAKCVQEVRWMLVVSTRLEDTEVKQVLLARTVDVLGAQYPLMKLWVENFKATSY